MSVTGEYFFHEFHGYSYCQHCNEPREKHADDKCLWQPTHYKGKALYRVTLRSHDYAGTTVYLLNEEQLNYFKAAKR